MPSPAAGASSSTPATSATTGPAAEACGLSGSQRPIPRPLLSVERAASPDGPILVGWDGSTGARQALATVRDLFGARRTVLAAVRHGTRSEPVPPGCELVDADIAAGHLATGRAVAETLTVLAAEQHAAAVVVGSRGRSAPREIVLGSVAMATLHHSPGPVVVVPHRRRGRSVPHTVVMAVAYRLSEPVVSVAAARPASRRAMGTRNGEQET